jgi:hypothetical protein
VLPQSSTVCPEGPLAHALNHLTLSGLPEEVAEIQRLLTEWLYYREQTLNLRYQLACLREQLARAQRFR